jgi:hypothetical protein
MAMLTDHETTFMCVRTVCLSALLLSGNSFLAQCADTVDCSGLARLRAVMDVIDKDPSADLGGDFQSVEREMMQTCHDTAVITSCGVLALLSGILSKSTSPGVRSWAVESAVRLGKAAGQMKAVRGTVRPALRDDLTHKSIVVRIWAAEKLTQVGFKEDARTFCVQTITRHDIDGWLDTEYRSQLQERLVRATAKRDQLQKQLAGTQSAAERELVNSDIQRQSLVISLLHQQSGAIEQWKSGSVRRILRMLTEWPEDSTRALVRKAVTENEYISNIVGDTASSPEPRADADPTLDPKAFHRHLMRYMETSGK